MPTFPLPLYAHLPAEKAASVAAWWDSLSDANRSDLLALWDRRGNDCRFSYAGEGEEPPAWHRLPLVEAEYTDESEPGDDWRPEWFDFLVSNPDKWTIGAPPPRTFHIGCTSHPAARAVLQAGFIPAGFECPQATAECPMRTLLDQQPGRSIKLLWNGPGGLMSAVNIYHDAESTP